MGICERCDGLIRDTRAGEMKIKAESCVDELEIDANLCGECRGELLRFLRGCNCPELKWVPRDIEW
jgi:hypothetical protein